MPDSTLPPGRSGRLLTAKEAAAHLSLSLRTVRRMIADGRLSIKRIGGSIRIKPEDLRALIDGSDDK
jgi:excisionase family DNA binding protein